MAKSTNKPSPPKTQAPDISLETLRKLWLTLSLILLLFALTAHGATQGADIGIKLKPFAEFFFEASTPDSIISMWGVIFTSILMLLSNPLMLRHARTVKASAWENYPFRLLDVPPTSNIGKTAARLTFFAFNLLPLVALGHFWRVFVKEGVICSFPDGQQPALATPSSHVLSLPGDWTLGRILFDGYRLGSTEFEASACENATTFFPVIEPLIMAGLTVCALWTFWNVALAVLSIFAD